jgi:SAM-dependent methyltransferase
LIPALVAAKLPARTHNKVNPGMTKSDKIASVYERIRNKLIPSRCTNWPQALNTFKGKAGLEVGGPSKVFGSRGILPVYPVARVDNCVFSERTLWATHAKDTLICEATDIAVQDASYDFVLASHVLEHCANPLKALKEWRRILKPGGTLFMVLPDQRRTFDHRRPVTSFEHMLEDYAQDQTEADLTHLDEILRLHDLARDPSAGTFEQFKARSLQNAENRCLHQHVFDETVTKQLLEHAGFEVDQQEWVRPIHMVTYSHRRS